MIVVRMTLEKGFYLVEIRRLRSFFGKRPIHVVMNQHNQSDLAGEVEDPVQRRVLQARNRTGDLGGYELLVNGELANAGEYTRKSLQHPANMIHRVHVGGIESRDHGIEPRLLLRPRDL